MAEPKNTLKEQRDRFLAFAFASADLFIEITQDGQIDYILGAAKRITGTHEDNLIGSNWLDLFKDEDRPSLIALHRQAKPVMRCGPLLVTLKTEATEEGQIAVMTGILMPESEKFFVTLGFTSVLMTRTAAALRDAYEHQALDKDTFIEAAQEAMTMARNLGQTVDLTLLDINVTEEAKKRFGQQNLDQFRSDIINFLSSKSLDGATAAEIQEGKYSVLHEAELGSEFFNTMIESYARRADPTGQGLRAKDKTVRADLTLMDERATTKALVYTLNEFERQGTNLTIESLNTSFQAYLATNTHRINVFKSLIKQLNFDFNFQPIVDLNTHQAHHYEMLARFPDGNSPYEWIVFGEDVGLAADFDLAVVERAINYIRYKAANNWMKFSVNLSGQSLKNDEFLESLLEKLSKNPEAKDRLMFELTDSCQIENLAEVAKRIETLQARGYPVCLDDFGTGSAYFQYLNHLDVRFVKIDGQYIHKMTQSNRDATMVRNLVNCCKDLDILTIAEMIETEEQSARLQYMGCNFAQGFLFARPAPKPEYGLGKKAAKS